MGLAYVFVARNSFPVFSEPEIAVSLYNYRDNSSFRSAADSDDYIAFYFMQVMQGSQLCMDPMKFYLQNQLVASESTYCLLEN